VFYKVIFFRLFFLRIEQCVLQIEDDLTKDRPPILEKGDLACPYKKISDSRSEASCSLLPQAEYPAVSIVRVTLVETFLNLVQIYI
jgi:hypothetical protein